MASTIITRTFSSVQDNRAVLTNSNFVRPIAAGNWNTLRVCARVSITDPGAGIFPQPNHFAIGLCSGSTFMFIGNTRQFIGMMTNIGTGGFMLNMVKNVGPPFWISPRFFPSKKVGSVITGVSGGTAVTNPYADTSFAQNESAPGVNPRRSLCFVDITRPNLATAPTMGNYAIKAFFRTTAAVTYDASVTDFLTQAVAVTPVLSDHTLADTPAEFTTTVPIVIDGNELTLGALDHVCVAWDNSQCSFEISDVGFVKML